MAATGVQVYVALILLIPCTAGSAYIKKYTMEDYCGGFLDMGVMGKYFKLQLTRHKHYDRNMDCGMQIRMSGLFDTRLFIQFLDIDIDCSDRLQIYDGQSASSSKLGSSVCGEDKPDHFVTSSQYVYLKFTSDDEWQDEGFTLLINSFHTGFCSNTEFQCDNGRCINKNLQCDKYDNCGDGSEHCSTSYKYSWWIGLTVGIAVFFVICSAIAIICCCFCKRSRPGKVITNTIPSVHYSSSTNTVTPCSTNPWYSTAAQTAQPLPPQITHQNTTGLNPPGQASYRGPPIPQPPAYMPTSGTPVYPVPKSDVTGPEAVPNAPPPYSEKPPNLN